MRRVQALALALSLSERPRAARSANALPVPKGVTFVLEVAAGDEQAIREAARLTGRSEADLRNAAGFFIEQILLAPTADSHRILGSNRDATSAELRRHMALIMRWLHPDLVSDKFGNDLNRSLYTKRVTEAWEFIKAQKRQAGSEVPEPRRNVSAGEVESKSSKGQKSISPHRIKRLGVSRLETNHFLAHFLLMIGVRR